MRAWTTAICALLIIVQGYRLCLEQLSDISDMPASDASLDEYNLILSMEGIAQSWHKIVLQIHINSSTT